jgi:hypothetical protein
MLKACVAAVSAFKTDTAHGVVAARLIIMDAGQSRWIPKSIPENTIVVLPASTITILTKCDSTHS